MFSSAGGNSGSYSYKRKGGVRLDITKEVLASILKSVDEAIHVVNTDGITILYNEVAAKHDGLIIAEVLGKPLLSVFPSLNENTSTLLNVLKWKQPIMNQRQSYVNLHGKKIETINTTLPLFIDDQLIGAVEIGKDYSRIKTLYERLIDLEKGLKKTGRKLAHEQVSYTLNDLKTINPGFLQLIERAKKLALSNSPVIVFGESGTGKELFSQGIHHASPRKSGPFIAQNCAAIPATLLESILFGTVKGSYTGAIDRPGLFELADGGTLFLDELHTMPVDLQAKFLRVLEEDRIRRIGSTASTLVDVRVVVAMNEHPLKAVAEQKLRADLFYRLNVLTFELVPLRERTEDIRLLAQYFIDIFNDRLEKQIFGMTENAECFFQKYHWPGNVRELKHTIEYMMNVCEGNVLTEADIPTMLKKQRYTNTQELPLTMSLRNNLDQMERSLISKALKLTNGNIKQAAKLLELPRQTLQYKLKKIMPNNGLND
jgi:arginine utilization regulatory protein